ncbi:OmpA family protein [Janthinobacterium fluminis]|uniref:OmpA family protein n=1 Tax=Janthinobacterium fluminis TaxID=2987524 RepID=A0ABT5K3S8_9BURK|nr:OmpA family protein [Janthinobacterium fluminis]MDC8758382.1 OmpA family protein [Janthinobacterium fluminis]
MMSRLNKHLSRIVAALAILLPLAACQTAPAQHGLNAQQIATLRQQGFQQSEAGWELSFTDKLLFDFDASSLTAPSRDAVSKISDALRQVGIEHLQIEGHTDTSGSDAHNDKLSLARANAVAEAMGLSGIARNNILVRGMGKNKPVADNATAGGRAENRRVTVIVSAP